MLATDTPGAAPTQAALERPAGDQPITGAFEDHGLVLRAQSDAQPRTKGDPPTWAATAAKAEAAGLTLSGPIAPSAGNTWSVSLLRSNGQRVFSAQAQRHEGEDDNRDRLLRAGLNAALWTMGAR